MLADYIENFDSMFPEAELALSVRVSPTTWINNSVYADQDTVESTGSELDRNLETNMKKYKRTNHSCGRGCLQNRTRNQR